MIWSIPADFMLYPILPHFCIWDMSKMCHSKTHNLHCIPAPLHYLSLKSNQKVITFYEINSDCISEANVMTRTVTSLAYSVESVTERVAGSNMASLSLGFRRAGSGQLWSGASGSRVTEALLRRQLFLGWPCSSVFSM